MTGPQTLFSSLHSALCFAQQVADSNGAPVRVVYDRDIQWYFIDEEPDDDEWPDSWVDAAIVEPGGWA